MDESFTIGIGWKFKFSSFKFSPTKFNYISPLTVTSDKWAALIDLDKFQTPKHSYFHCFSWAQKFSTSFLNIEVTGLNPGRMNKHIYLDEHKYASFRTLCPIKIWLLIRTWRLVSLPSGSTQPKPFFGKNETPLVWIASTNSASLLSRRVITSWPSNPGWATSKPGKTSLFI